MIFIGRDIRGFSLAWHWGLRYCGIGQFFMRFFGNFNLELRYFGILQTCGMRFLDVLVDDFRYKNVSFTFSGRFGSTLKQPYIVTHFNLQFDYFNNPFKAVPLFPRSHRSFLPLFLLSRQGIHQLYRLTIKLRYFQIFFFFFSVLRYLSNFFAVMRCSATPNIPLLCVIDWSLGREVACASIGSKFSTASTCVSVWPGLKF